MPKNCFLCNSSPKPYLDNKTNPLSEKVFICKDCQLLLIDVTQGINHSFDNEKRALPEGLMNRLQVKSTIKQLCRLMDFESLRSVLEIGSGNCKVAAKLKQTHPHLKLCAVDKHFNEESLNRCRSNQIDTLETDLNSSFHEHFQPNSLDLIYALHVIDHLKDPTQIIHDCFQILKPGGQLIILVHDFTSFEAKLFKNSVWSGYHFPWHPHIFSTRSMDILVSKLSWTNKRFFHVPASGSWVLSVNKLFKNKTLKSFFTIQNPFAHLPFFPLDLILTRLGNTSSNLIVVLSK
jgi:predicted SAM-dependent methyltransferase